MSVAEGWNETEVPINISIVTEAINVSEDLLEDDNESTELDGNLSDAKLASVSLRTHRGTEVVQPGSRSVTFSFL